MLVAFGAISMLYIGAQWQQEIAVINISNNWNFVWFMCLWEMSNWAAYDFFRLIMDFCYLASFTIGIGLGYYIYKFKEKTNKSKSQQASKNQKN